MPTLRKIYAASPEFVGMPPPPPSPLNMTTPASGYPAPPAQSNTTASGPAANTSSFSANDLVIIADLARHLPSAHSQPAPIPIMVLGKNITLAAQQVPALTNFIPLELWGALAPVAFSFTLAGNHVYAPPTFPLNASCRAAQARSLCMADAGISCLQATILIRTRLRRANPGSNMYTCIVQLHRNDSAPAKVKQILVQVHANC